MSESTSSSPSTHPTRPDRAGKRVLSAHVAPETYRQFAILSAELGKGHNDLLHEALALLLKNYGKELPPEIARKLPKPGPT